VPTYAYRCPTCDWIDEITKPMSDSNTEEKCRQCGAVLERDYRAEVPSSMGSDTYEARAIHSDSLAIHPSQRAEHERLYPDVPLDSACRPVLNNFKQHERYLEARGVVKRPHLREF
jgi:putative FmdB family regulatory protein